jgi:hypothetical protein
MKLMKHNLKTVSVKILRYEYIFVGNYNYKMVQYYDLQETHFPFFPFTYKYIYRPRCQSIKYFEISTTRKYMIILSMIFIVYFFKTFFLALSNISIFNFKYSILIRNVSKT